MYLNTMPAVSLGHQTDSGMEGRTLLSLELFSVTLSKLKKKEPFILRSEHQNRYVEKEKHCSVDDITGEHKYCQEA